MAFLIVLFICVVVPISERGGYASFPGYMLFLSVVAAAMWGNGTSRIVVDGDDLCLVNWATTTRVARSNISGVDGVNGVIVHTVDAQHIESFAYGSSVLQFWLHSKRYRAVADRIDRWASDGRGRGPALLGTSADDGWHTHRSERSPRRLRKWIRVGFPVLIAATQVLGVVLWLLSPWLLPIVVG